MRGDAKLRDSVHLVGADLDLDRLAGVGDDRRVQRLVAVRLRHRDVVLEPTGHRLPQRVDHAQNPIAVAHAIDLHPDRRQVIDLGEVLLLAGHLLPDRVDVFGPTGDLGTDFNLVELARQDLAQV